MAQVSSAVHRPEGEGPPENSSVSTVEALPTYDQRKNGLKIEIHGVAAVGRTVPLPSRPHVGQFLLDFCALQLHWPSRFSCHRANRLLGLSPLKIPEFATRVVALAFALAMHALVNNHLQELVHMEAATIVMIGSIRTGSMDNRTRLERRLLIGCGILNIRSFADWIICGARTDFKFFHVFYLVEIVTASLAGPPFLVNRPRWIDWFNCILWHDIFSITMWLAEISQFRISCIIFVYRDATSDKPSIVATPMRFAIGHKLAFRRPP